MDKTITPVITAPHKIPVSPEISIIPALIIIHISKIIPTPSIASFIQFLFLAEIQKAPRLVITFVIHTRFQI